MTRKQERRRRVAAWAATIGLGGAMAVAAGGWIAIAILAIAAAIGHRIMIAPPGVAVLTYHSISTDARWLPWSREITVHPATLERHLATLRQMGAAVIGTREYCALRAANAPLPRNAVLLHFDDGYRDNLANAVPALERYAMPATIFVSLDFVEPGEAPRAATPDAQGYLNWPELRAIEAGGLIEIEPHGVDHARVPVSGEVVDRLTAGNWRRHAWVQWRATPGAKHDWFRSPEQALVALGSPVLRSAPALSARTWTRDGVESETAMAARIERDLTACRATFATRLGREPQIFCWPENAAAPVARQIAARLAYVATTGGRQRNVAGENPNVLSRIHMGDRALGWRWLAAEALHLRGAVRLMQGNHYWYLVIAPMNLTRTIVMAVRERLDMGAR